MQGHHPLKTLYLSTQTTHCTSHLDTCSCYVGTPSTQDLGSVNTNYSLYKSLRHLQLLCSDTIHSRPWICQHKLLIVQVTQTLVVVMQRHHPLKTLDLSTQTTHCTSHLDTCSCYVGTPSTQDLGSVNTNYSLYKSLRHLQLLCSDTIHSRPWICQHKLLIVQVTQTLVVVMQGHHPLKTLDLSTQTTHCTSHLDTCSCYVGTPSTQDLGSVNTNYSLYKSLRRLQLLCRDTIHSRPWICQHKLLICTSHLDTCSCYVGTPSTQDLGSVNTNYSLYKSLRRLQLLCRDTIHSRPWICQHKLLICTSHLDACSCYVGTPSTQDLGSVNTNYSLYKSLRHLQLLCRDTIHSRPWICQHKLLIVQVTQTLVVVMQGHHPLKTLDLSTQTTHCTSHLDACSCYAGTPSTQDLGSVNTNYPLYKSLRHLQLLCRDTIHSRPWICQHKLLIVQVTQTLVVVMQGHHPLKTLDLSTQTTHCTSHLDTCSCYVGTPSTQDLGSVNTNYSLYKSLRHLQLLCRDTIHSRPWICQHKLLIVQITQTLVVVMQRHHPLKTLDLSTQTTHLYKSLRHLQLLCSDTIHSRPWICQHKLLIVQVTQTLVVVMQGHHPLKTLDLSTQTTHCTSHLDTCSCYVGTPSTQDLGSVNTNYSFVQVTQTLVVVMQGHHPLKTLDLSTQTTHYTSHLDTCSCYVGTPSTQYLGSVNTNYSLYKSLRHLQLLCSDTIHSRPWICQHKLLICTSHLDTCSCNAGTPSTQDLGSVNTNYSLYKSLRHLQLLCRDTIHSIPWICQHKLLIVQVTQTLVVVMQGHHPLKTLDLSTQTTHLYKSLRHLQL